MNSLYQLLLHSVLGWERNSEAGQGAMENFEMQGRNFLGGNQICLYQSRGELPIETRKNI